MYGEMPEKNRRFFSGISPYIMYNKIYPCSKECRMAHKSRKNVKSICAKKFGRLISELVTITSRSPTYSPQSCSQSSLRMMLIPPPEAKLLIDTNICFSYEKKIFKGSHTWN